MIGRRQTGGFQLYQRRTNNKNQEGFVKILFPDFASNLGLSICEFNILKNATKRRCRNGNNLDVLCLHIDDVGPQEMRLLQCTEYYQQWPPPQPNPGQNVGGG